MQTHFRPEASLLFGDSVYHLLLALFSKGHFLHIAHPVDFIQRCRNNLHIASNIKNLGGGERIINVWMFKAHGVSLKADSPAAVWIRLSIEHTLNAALFMHITASRRCVMLKCTNINLDSKYGNNYNEH